MKVEKKFLSKKVARGNKEFVILPWFQKVQNSCVKQKGGKF